MTGGVHRFRLAASPLLGVALGAGVLFFILVLGTIFGPDQSGIDLLVLAVSGLVLGGLALVALRLRKHKPVALEVGPSGIRLALWARALPWSDLREIRRERHFSPVGPGRDWLVLVLEEGARPPGGRARRSGRTNPRI